MMRSLGSAFLLSTVLGVLGAPSRGAAQHSAEVRPHQKPTAAQSNTLERHDAEAHALLSAGASALGDGRFEDALDYFERSYKLSGKPEILYNIGLAQDRLRHDREAAQAFEMYLKLSADKQRRADARARLKVLKRALGRTPSTSPARDTVVSTAPGDAGNDAGAASAPAALPGQRTVVAAPPPSTPMEESPLLRGL